MSLNAFFVCHMYTTVTKLAHCDTFLRNHEPNWVPEMNLNHIQEGVFSGLVTYVGTKRFSLPKICHTYPTIMKLDTDIPYLKKIQKIYKSFDTSLHFFTQNQQNFAISRKTDIDCILRHNF